MLTSISVSQDVESLHRKPAEWKRLTSRSGLPMMAVGGRSVLPVLKRLPLLKVPHGSIDASSVPKVSQYTSFSEK